MTKHYTELTGAIGSRVQFGVPRFDADTYFLNAAPIVRIGEGAFALKDIGALEFSILSHETIPLDADKASVEAVFEQNGVEIAKVVILTPTAPVDGVIECRLFDRVIDLDQLSHENAAAVVTTKKVYSAPRHSSAVPPEYKIFCADILDLLATHRRQLSEDIEPFAASLTAGERGALDGEIEQAVRDDWMAMMRRGDDLILPLKNDPDTRQKWKRFTENLVTRELCAAPNWERSYAKPMGYPGDYKIMDDVYSHRPCGDDIYTRYLYILGLITGWPIATRMEYISREIHQLAEKRPDHNHFHVMSIGSGPAVEIQRFFKNVGPRAEGYSFTLVDPEAQALEHAIKHIYASIKNSVSSVVVSGMNTSFTDMLRPMSTFRHLPPQDLIYSAGLVDYLNPKLARSLIGKLFECLRPGGSVIIGNVNDAGLGNYWPLEYALDWTLYFRNLEEMHDIADGIAGHVSVEPDESGAMYMLKVTKPE